MNNNKYLIPVLLIGAVIALIIGSTFAYWSWASNNSDKTNVAFTVASNFSCSADGGGDIVPGNAGLAPTTCNNNQYAVKRTITLNATSPDILSLNMWLNVNSMDTELRNSNNFKYTLVPSGMNCNDGVHYTFGSTISNNKVMLLDGVTQNKTSTTTYDLYIWLDAAETNNNTQNKTFNLSLGGECTNEITTKVQTANDAMFDTGINVNKKMKNLAEDDTSTDGTATIDRNITAIKYANIAPDISSMTSDNIVSVSTVPIYM